MYYPGFCNPFSPTTKGEHHARTRHVQEAERPSFEAGAATRSPRSGRQVILVLASPTTASCRGFLFMTGGFIVKYRRRSARGFVVFPKGHGWGTAEYIAAYIRANHLTT